jgi:hypothetical protein
MMLFAFLPERQKYLLYPVILSNINALISNNSGVQIKKGNKKICALNFKRAAD